MSKIAKPIRSKLITNFFCKKFYICLARSCFTVVHNGTGKEGSSLFNCFPHIRIRSTDNSRWIKSWGNKNGKQGTRSGIIVSVCGVRLLLLREISPSETEKLFFFVSCASVFTIRGGRLAYRSRLTIRFTIRTKLMIKTVLTIEIRVDLFPLSRLSRSKYPFVSTAIKSQYLREISNCVKWRINWNIHRAEDAD